MECLLTIFESNLSKGAMGDGQDPDGDIGAMDRGMRSIQ